MDDNLPIAARRGRLSEVERELARLRYRHDIAMSAFRFEEATALGPAIAPLEQERQALITALPPVPIETGRVPVLTRPRGAGGWVERSETHQKKIHHGGHRGLDTKPPCLRASVVENWWVSLRSTHPTKGGRLQPPTRFETWGRRWRSALGRARRG